MVSLVRDDHVAVVTLERAEALNALSGGMAEALADAFAEASADPRVWAVVLRAAGDRAFCVGADLKERAAFTVADFHRNRGHVRRMFEELRAVRQPTVAAVFGYALGGGFELALSCDLIVAAQGTRLGLPEVLVGLVPGGGGTQLLARRAGLGRAKDLVLTGRRIDADEARAAGIVTRVVPRDRLDDEALALARDVCKASPVAVRHAKHAIEAGFGRSLKAGLEIEDAAWTSVVASLDRSEGIAAFNEKRTPRWRNE